jgi:gas vesicle protein
VGMLTAPTSGEESRSAIAGKVRDVSERVKKHVSSERNPAMGT